MGITSGGGGTGVVVDSSAANGTINATTVSGSRCNLYIENLYRMSSTGVASLAFSRVLK